MDIISITSKNEMTEGLFGMVMLFIFEVLPILDLIRVDIDKLKWDITTVNYGNIFPNVLEYNSKYVDNNYENKILYVPLNHLRRKLPQWVLGDNFTEINKLFFKYFKIPQRIQSIVDQFDLSDHLGIHFRGTDKTTDFVMNTPLSIDDFYIVLDSYIKENHQIKNIFLATDEKNMIEYLKTKYVYINFITSRNLDGYLFWKNCESTERNATEAMIDMLCLSKCKVVLKVSSALSSFSKVINPNLEIYRINALKMFTDIPYFPDAYIPLLCKNEKYSEECNSILEKVQKNEWRISHEHVFNNFVYKPRRGGLLS